MKLKQQVGHADYSCLLWLAAAAAVVVGLLGAGAAWLVIELVGSVLK
jgi:hypothetical protein